MTIFILLITILFATMSLAPLFAAKANGPVCLPQ